MCVYGNHWDKKKPLDHLGAQNLDHLHKYQMLLTAELCL